MFISQAATPLARSAGLKQQQKDAYQNLLCIAPNQHHFYHNQLRLCTRKPFKSLLSFKASPQSHHISKRKDDFPVHGLSETIVGVLGGGELTRMLCQAASQMGIKVNVLDPNKNCPASALAHYHMVGSYNDSAMVRKFAKRCGVLTVENEHVNVATIENLEAQGINCQPKASTIRISQDKYLQKVHFYSHDISVPKFMQIDDLESAKRAGELFGYPLMIKKRRLAYAGLGNAVANSEEKISSAVNYLGGYDRGLYAEEFATIDKELGVSIAMGHNDSIEGYEVVEAIHRENTCHIVKAPVNLSHEITDLAIDVAEKAVCSLEGAVVFTVKLFLTKDGQVLVNKVVPRPHNMGDYTIESCYNSQYKNHLRAILGLPLGSSDMKVSATIMCNILGEDEGKAGFILARQQFRHALNISQASVHWYDKQDGQIKRKMGHFTIVGPSMAEVETELKSLLNEEDLDTQLPVKPRVGIIVGSDTDNAVMEDAKQIFEMFGVPYELETASPDPTWDTMASYASYAECKGFEVIIAGASGAPHFPGMVASKTVLPVIGVPICHSKPVELDSGVHVTPSALKGIDALLSIAQMPERLQVATVGINNAADAALMAIRIISLFDVDLALRLPQYLEDMKSKDSSKA